MTESGSQTHGGEEQLASRLLEVGRSLAADLDVPAILDRVLQAARELTGARYAAIGVLDEQRARLARFFTSGVDADTYRRIGELPTGRGVLGALVSDPRPLRLREVADHPLSYGMPHGHPPMHSFLGVPLLIRGQAWGNLYLAEKQGSPEFSDADEQAAVILAEWAGAAIENARLYERSEQRRAQLERAVAGLEATRDIAAAIGGATALPRVLELIVKRGRALVGARSFLVMLREGEEMVVAASAGYATGGAGRLRLPLVASGSQALWAGPRRIADVASELELPPALLGVPDARTALLVPMRHAGESNGLLAAFDRGAEAKPFTDADEQLLETFAASAANAVASAHTVRADRLRSAIAASDAERRRWARELHDETLQTLGSLRELAGGALRQSDSHRREAAMRELVAGIEQGMERLGTIITDLWPTALEGRGLEPAIEELLEQRRADGLRISADLRLEQAKRLDPSVQATIYRMLQEALSNVVRHAQASNVDAAVEAANGSVSIAVSDDGTGFDVDGEHAGFGLAAMRDHVELAGGRLEIRSDARGTLVRATLPSRSGRTAEGAQRAADGVQRIPG